MAVAGEGGSDARDEGAGVGREEVTVELLEASIGLEGVGVVVRLMFGRRGRFACFTGNEVFDHLKHTLLKLNNLLDVVGLGEGEMPDRINLFLADFALMIHSNYLHEACRVCAGRLATQSLAINY